jgi:hypothetical protein
MGPTSTQVTTTTAASSSCHSTGRGVLRWPSGWRSLIIAGAITAAAVGLALGQHWLATAQLAPALFVLPCAAMMFMCMKGDHGQQTNTLPASTQGATQSVTDTQS